MSCIQTAMWICSSRFPVAKNLRKLHTTDHKGVSLHVGSLKAMRALVNQNTAVPLCQQPLDQPVS